MSQLDSFDGSLRLFEEMDGLADSFIEEAMLPDSLPPQIQKLYDNGRI